MIFSKLRLIFLAAVLVINAGCFLPLLVSGGAASTVAIATDRRPASVILADQSIESKAKIRIKDFMQEHEQDIKKLHVNIVSYDRIVLLSGEVPNEEIKSEIYNTVRAIDEVKGVHNALIVAPVSALSSRSKDSYITGKIKSSYIATSGISARIIKVVTERKVVYLMGLVTKEEEELASRIASETSDVEKVVLLFQQIRLIQKPKDSGDNLKKSRVPPKKP